MRRTIPTTGGRRSDKSSFAEKKTHELTASSAHLVAVKIQDKEFGRRMERHQKNHGLKWTNIEEEKELDRHDIADKVIMIDCVTLWCTNFSMKFDPNVAPSLEAIKREFDRFIQQDVTFILVINETGQGGVSGNKLQRRFTDLQS